MTFTSLSLHSRKVFLTVIILCLLPTMIFGENATSSKMETAAVGDNQEEHIRMVVLLSLIPIVVIFSFVVFIFYRQKREAFFRQSEAELKLSKIEVEIKALKAQINPHFIFNSMNSIHHYMHKNDIGKASDYLIKFSQLIRMVLENSSRKLITLCEDLQALELYIKLEQLRLNFVFDYQIHVDDRIEQEHCEVPALLIQPFVENGIWHGLTKIKEKGTLTIHIAQAQEGLICKIASEGVGQRYEDSPPSLTAGIQKTSLGLRLIEERLELINRMSETKAYFKINEASVPNSDRYVYEVELFIPFYD